MKKTSSSVLFALLLAFLLTVGLGSSALYASAPTGGDTVTVTRNDDPAPDGCQVGDCSLREAVIQANSTSTTTLIVISTTGTISLSIPGADEDASATGDLDVLTNVIIEGNGITIDANGIDRVFDVSSPPTRPALTPEGSSFNMADLTLTGGNVDINSDPVGGNVVGGGIRVRGGRSVYLQNVAIVGNSGTGGSFGFGGGIGIENGTALFTQGSVYSNTADNAAGIAVVDGFLQLENVTVSQNTSLGAVGGIINLSNTDGVTSTLALVDSTIVTNIENAPNQSGAGVDTTPLAGTAITTISNSIIANNVGDAQCYEGGTVTSLDYNILGDASCNLTGPNDLLSTDPQLQVIIGAPGPNGVVHYFHAPSAASPAIDSGSTDSIFDQIGTSRPQDLPGYPNTTTGVDRGAIEQLEAPTAVTVGALTVAGNGQALWPWTIAGVLVAAAGLVVLAKRR